MSALDSPVPLSDMESVLAWVDTFKLSRPTKKINRDFSDAVLLAEILSVPYPKLVEMHNYPPRNSHSLKLNNWMTLNRKVLKKLKLNLCCNTMEQLANCTPGVIERVLIMVRDKIRRDEDMNKSFKETEQNLSSGGSYYEACGDDDVLVVPMKTRVNGVLETIQQKVVSHESYVLLKEELKDVKESAETLKQKVDHLDNLLKLKDERIEELQKQLERKQTRRKEVEALQNSLTIPFEPEPPSPNIHELIPVPSKTLSVKNFESFTKISNFEESKLPKAPETKRSEESKIPIAKVDVSKCISKPSITEVTPYDINNIKHLNDEKEDPVRNNVDEIVIKESITKTPNSTESISGNNVNVMGSTGCNKINSMDKININKADILESNVDKVKSDVFKEIEIIDDGYYDGFHDTNDYIGESEANNDIKHREIENIYNANFIQKVDCGNIIQ